jgi:integrase
VKQRTRKHVELPEHGKFEQLVAEVRASGSGYAPPAAELVQFLAYGGLRIGEAKYVTWGDCDFTKGGITVRGHPDTGTKNSEMRRVPMIPDMRKLLGRMRSERQNESLESPIMRVWECQKSIDRASKVLGIKRITHHDRAPSRFAQTLSWWAGEELENSLISFGTTVSASGTTRGWKAILSVRAEASALRNWTGYAMPWRFTPTGVGSGWRVNFASGGSGALPKAD